MKTSLKYLFFTVLCLVLSCTAVDAQDRNSAADNITGKYFAAHKGEESKVKVSRLNDGTYQAQIYWVKNATDRNGGKRLDEKNPDKELRNVPCDEVVLFWNLKYNAEKKRWEKGKIYDPVRGVRANLSATFDHSGNLHLKGSLLGFSETVIWKPINE